MRAQAPRLALAVAGAAAPGALVGRWSAARLGEQVCCRSELDDFVEASRERALHLERVARGVRDVLRAVRRSRPTAAAECPAGPSREEELRREVLAAVIAVASLQVALTTLRFVSDVAERLICCRCCRRSARRTADGLRLGHRRRGGGVVQ